MGKVKRVLASKKLKPSSPNYCGIELCETVHIHLPDGLRLEYTTEQFKVFAETAHRALEKWVSLGKPITADFILLADAYLPSVPVYQTRFEVEEQTVPTIHIHLRGLSIRRSIPDFIEFADLIQEAKENLKG